MKTTKNLISIILLLTPGLQLASGQGFSSGSDGSYGPINVTVHTVLDAPPDGIFHCTTIDVAIGRRLEFNRNAKNTPVYLLATGKVTILGQIRVSGASGNNQHGGLAGPGGYDGGHPGFEGIKGGAGHGPGGGLPRDPAVDPQAEPTKRAGMGVYSSLGSIDHENRGAIYGSPLLVPFVGGSGGGGDVGTGGGAGGGAVLIASDTEIEIGSGDTGVRALGGGASPLAYNYGSGGAIRLIAPKVSSIGFGGSLDVSATFGQASPGRIRIDTLDRSEMNLVFNPTQAATVGSMMVVFPDPLPELNVIEAAGTVISAGSDPVFINLPFGTNPMQSINVQAKNFAQIVPISIVLTPDNGDPVTYQTQIDNAVANPAEVTVNVTFPVNVRTVVQVWTRATP